MHCADNADLAQEGCRFDSSLRVACENSIKIFSLHSSWQNKSHYNTDSKTCHLVTVGFIYFHNNFDADFCFDFCQGQLFLTSELVSGETMVCVP